MKKMSNQKNQKPKKVKYSPFDYVDVPQKRYIKTEWYARKLYNRGEVVRYDKECGMWYWEPRIHFHFYKMLKRIERSGKQPSKSHVTLADMTTLHLFIVNGKVPNEEYFDSFSESVIREIMLIQKAMDNKQFERVTFDDF